MFTKEKEWLEEDKEMIECPYCGSTWTHQNTVWIFNRCEDDDMTMVTRVWNPTIISQDLEMPSDMVRTKIMPTKMCPNPSSRRQGILIEFECEDCSMEQDPNNENNYICTDRNDFYCAVAQHKGSTILSFVLEQDIHPDFKKEFNKD